MVFAISLKFLAAAASLFLCVLAAGSKVNVRVQKTKFHDLYRETSQGDPPLIGWLPEKIDPAGASYDLWREDGYKSWMAELPKDTQLFSLSIPGTSNSMAYAKDMKDGERHQNFDIYTQLKQGMRYIDIPVYELGGQIWTDHCISPDDGDCNKPWPLICPLDPKNPDDEDRCILEPLQFWLANYVTETIIVRFRPEPAKLQDGGLKPLAELFWKELYTKRERDDGEEEKYEPLMAKRFVYSSKKNDWNFSLGKMRSKMLVVTEFAWEGYMDEDHIPWVSNDINSDGNLGVESVLDIEKKWEDVVNHIEFATVTAGSGGKVKSARQFFITHNGGSDRSEKITPETIAAGIADEGIEGMNARLLRKLTGMKKMGSPKRVGVIAMDFPSRALRNAIIGLNFKEDTYKSVF